MQIRTCYKPRVIDTLSVKRVASQQCRYARTVSPESWIHCQYRGWRPSDVDTHSLQAQSHRYIVSKEDGITAMQIHTFCEPRATEVSSVKRVA